ncbi:ATP-binding protein [Undibacterium sp. TJN19]|uniref:ATP-binding protein n=1 Tax=Undibacterium sp. TJN19 TaxID=3413055 RepID=UPI003BF0B1BC
MGRLFWKFFFFIWLAQLTAIAGISTTLWLKHMSDDGAAMHAERAEFAPPPLHAEPPPTLPSFKGGEAADTYPVVSPPRSSPGQRGFGEGRHPGPEQNSRAIIPMLGGLFASLLFAALLAWYMAKPIRRLSEAFQALADGNLHTRIGSSMGQRQDELTALGHDFDRMAEQLTGSLQSQRRLLHDVSHELRSPLARLQAAIGLARQQPERVDEYMARMEREATRMDKLIGELLTLSRLEAGATIGEDLVHLDELFAELIDNTRFEAQTAHKGFVAVCQPADMSNLCIRGRYELLYRALENVLRNALRHTRVDTSIALKVEQQQNRLQITVEDEGTGVPEAELKTIFAPFYRGQQAEQSTEGYGLGLAITQRVMQAHGGQIIASNRAGGGLCMQMTLPLARN